MGAGGHKALVSSQFTSFLALVRERLDAEGLAYEYSDGGTRDRASRVKQFQEDASVPIFLIRLRAGGLGSISRLPTVYSCSTHGGTPPSKRKRSTARIGSVRPNQCSPKGCSRRTPSKSALRS